VPLDSKFYSNEVSYEICDQSGRNKNSVQSFVVQVSLKNLNPGCKKINLLPGVVNNNKNNTYFFLLNIINNNKVNLNLMNMHPFFITVPGTGKISQFLVHLTCLLMLTYLFT
jgi:hypothetical protein